MSKREVLVHACGHIVQPGDTLVVERTLEDTPEPDRAIGGEMEFLGVIPGINTVGESRYIRVVKKGSIHVLHRNVKRFNCTVMEVGDE